jgi:Cu/Zn superoxide dismutase
MRRDRAGVKRNAFTFAAMLASLALAACSTMRGGAAPSTANVEVEPRPPAGLEARLRPLGSAVTGKVRVVDRNDGVTVLVSLANMPAGQYRIAFHEVPNCSSPNGYSAGRPWAPAAAARAARDITPPLFSNPEGNAEASLFVRGIHTTGADGLAGRSVIVYAGNQVTDALPDVPNNRAACGIFEPAQGLAL